MASREDLSEDFVAFCGSVVGLPIQAWESNMLRLIEAESRRYPSATELSRRLVIQRPRRDFLQADEWARPMLDRIARLTLRSRPRTDDMMQMLDDLGIEPAADLSFDYPVFISWDLARDELDVREAKEWLL